MQLQLHKYLFALLTLLTAADLFAQDAQQIPASTYDPQLARQLGADARGMRQYILVVLKTGPNKVAAGKERDAMFAGHFANMQRLSDAGKLVLAGPFDGQEGWRGLFVFAVNSVAEARELTATDPVIIQGEMIAEFHPWYGSAAVMEIPKIHPKLVEKKQP